MQEYRLRITSKHLTNEQLSSKVLQMEMKVNSEGVARVHIDELPKTSIELVEEFHETFGHVIEDRPIIAYVDDHRFRTAFMKEELDELDAAHLADDLIAYADGLGDLQYVLDGWFLNAGLQDKKQAIIEEIHRSNMTKICKTREEAKATIGSLILKHTGLFDLHEEQQGENWIVYRSHDRKVMKSINYQPPNLKDIIYEQTT